MTNDLIQLDLAIGLIGGLAIFLFGMEIMTRALKLVAGNSLKNMLARMTQNRFTGLLAGAGVTALIQSSSVTTVLLVGFISAGLMTTLQAVPVIIGANIGTTVTAQILAFRIEALALPLLSLGFFTSLLARTKSSHEYGRILLGLGLIFFGMAIMSEAMQPLRNYKPFIDFMLSLDNVLLAALVGAVFTALVQSSSATTGILIVMAGQGLIALEPAVALVLGANIGTCVTALLASVGHEREAVRTALVHTLFNVAGVLLWVGLVDELAMVARALSSSGTQGDTSGVPRQLANVHTLFNLCNAFLFLPFANQLARLVRFMVPDKAEAPVTAGQPKHLNPEFLEVPALAIDAVRLETVRLAQLLREMLTAAVPALTTGSPLDVDQVHVMDRPIDLLHREIVSYIRRISLRRLPPAQSAAMLNLIKIGNDIEHAGDLIATGLATSARKRMDEGVIISPPTAKAIAQVHEDVVAALDGILDALEQETTDTAAEVRARKEDFQSRIDAFAAHEMARLRTDDPNRMQTYAREVELVETLNDIFKIFRRIALTELDLFRAKEQKEAL
ncbi:MAG: Na/Pi cotransporter family protein [Sulfitobacter sp.]|nr:Na/Pi cotransporter family protein [Sulfitobacter sp.]